METNFDLRDYIVSFDNMLDEYTCDQILERYNNSNKWIEAVTNGSTLTQERSKSRVCYTIHISEHQSEKNIDETLYNVFCDAVQRYSEKFPFFSCKRDEGYFLLKYLEGGKYSQHIDAGSENHRIVSVILQLNDDFTGGELKFFNGKHTQKLKKGTVCVFPSCFTYPHQITPVLSGERYSVVSWFN